jgi:hypothetical protein
MQKMMYLLVSQHVSGIIMPIIGRMVENRQRLWCTALAVLQLTSGEEVVRCAHYTAFIPRTLKVIFRAVEPHIVVTYV